MINKKKWMLALSSLLLLAAAGCSFANNQSKEPDKLTLFVASDIHYLAPELNDNGEAFQKYMTNSDGKFLRYIDPITNAFIRDVKDQKPDVLIISGDLTNNGEKASHKELADKLESIEQETGTKIYVIPGNHDIKNPWARGFQGSEQYVTDTITPEDFADIYQDFGYTEAVSRDEGSLSYLATPSKDLWLLMLDTSISEFNELMGNPMINGELSPETLAWIRKCGEQAKNENARLVAVMHHNLLDHSKVLNKGFTLDNNEEALEVFKECGIQLVFSGHIHLQNIKSDGTDHPIYDIATGSLGVYPVQYGILTFDPTDGFDYNTSLVDVEGWAKAEGIEDENLTGFSDYSKAYYSEASLKKAKDRLAEVEGYTDKEKQMMAETMGKLNLNYFAGTIDKVREEILASEGYHLWETADPSVRTKNYILSVLEDGKDNHNHLTLR